MTWSSDGGRTWTPLAAAALPNPNSAVDGVTLTDGRLLLVYNHAAHNPEWSGHGRRYPLDVAISRDGLTWVHVLTLEDQPERAGARSRPITEPPARTSAEQLDIINKGFAYPAVIQTSDGLVHVTYTIDRHEIKHVVIDPKRLR